MVLFFILSISFASVSADSKESVELLTFEEVAMVATYSIATMNEQTVEIGDEIISITFKENFNIYEYLPLYNIEEQVVGYRVLFTSTYDERIKGYVVISLGMDLPLVMEYGIGNSIFDDYEIDKIYYYNHFSQYYMLSDGTLLNSSFNEIEVNSMKNDFDLYDNVRKTLYENDYEMIEETITKNKELIGALYKVKNTYIFTPLSLLDYFVGNNSIITSDDLSYLKQQAGDGFYLDEESLVNRDEIDPLVQSYFTHIDEEVNPLYGFAVNRHNNVGVCGKTAATTVLMWYHQHYSYYNFASNDSISEHVDGYVDANYTKVMNLYGDKQTYYHPYYGYPITYYRNTVEEVKKARQIEIINMIVNDSSDYSNRDDFIDDTAEGEIYRDLTHIYNGITNNLLFFYDNSVVNDIGIKNSFEHVLSLEAGIAIFLANHGTTYRASRFIANININVGYLSNLGLGQSFLNLYIGELTDYVFDETNLSTYFQNPIGPSGKNLMESSLRYGHPNLLGSLYSASDILGNGEYSKHYVTSIGMYKLKKDIKVLGIVVGHDYNDYIQVFDNWNSDETGFIDWDSYKHTTLYSVSSGY
jgi:hypothetical protein